MIEIRSNIPNLNVQAVREAADFLGLTGNLFIALDRGLGHGSQYKGYHQRGHRMRRLLPTRHHIIVIGACHAGSSATLWHELAHAAQCEHWHGFDWRRFFTEYNDALRAVSIKSRRGNGHERYKSVKWERDANEHALLATDHPLYY